MSTGLEIPGWFVVLRVAVLAASVALIWLG
jgi:hypothetical protein